MLKVKWLNKFITNESSFWFCIPRGIFRKLGGIDFLLRCDFTVSRLPIKLASFHQQILLYWKLYNHNLTPHKTPIWNNRFILSRYKSLCILEWFEKGVWSVLHLMDEDGSLLCTKYNLQCEYKQFERVLNAIPKSFMNLVHNTSVNRSVGACELPSLLFNGNGLKAMFPTNLFALVSLYIISDTSIL